MRASDLSHDVRACLRHYPPPHEAHRGVVPSSPTRGPVGMGGPDVGRRVAEAERALVRLTAEFEHSKSAFALTRILERQEAVSSSSIEGTQSTLDALLELEEDGVAGDETLQARRSHQGVSGSTGGNKRRCRLDRRSRQGSFDFHMEPPAPGGRLRLPRGHPSLHAR